jgi:hypothetical protein
VVRAVGDCVVRMTSDCVEEAFQEDRDSNVDEHDIDAQHVGDDKHARPRAEALAHNRPGGGGGRSERQSGGREKAMRGSDERCWGME